MKTLFLVRHAKSSWDDTTLHDRDRPLAARGERDAATMSARLVLRDVRPDVIVSSPAARALATARVLARGLGCKFKDVVVDDRLYATTAAALMAFIDELDDRLECVMLVGHNPEFTALAHRFAPHVTHMPTCAIAEFAFEANTWRGIGLAPPVRSDFDSPKNEPRQDPKPA